jgi:tetratricopeptide (TPR) repeat protein
MARQRASTGERAPRPRATPEDLLQKAMGARSPAARARFARRGLAARAPLDQTTQAMLLRQLYLAHFELRHFDRAHAVALQALELDVLSDVLHQDAARASLAGGNAADALSHLRRAARRAPVSRRAFHLWTLGSALFLMHQYAEATGVLARAVRWGTHDKPLYRGHLALVRVAMGEHVDDLQAAIDDLACAHCGQGYGRFVLGHLAYAAGKWVVARRYLQAFVRRTEGARPALAIALGAELAMARATLAKMAAN